MGCEPGASEVVVKFQVPLPLAVPLPNEEAPSMNVIVPVGVPEYDELTAAVKVTTAPGCEGLEPL